MTSKPIQMLMDCHTTKRWTLCATSIESNVASHSFNVTAIALDIFERLEDKHGFSAGHVALHALFHDADETETGDIPTPTKTALRAVGVDLHRLTPTQGRFPPIPDFIGRIIKLADLIENYIFIKWYGVGPRSKDAAAEVLNRLEAKLRSESDELRRAATATLDEIVAKEDGPEMQRGW